jgi:creatinine amidohydrolase
MAAHPEPIRNRHLTAAHGPRITLLAERTDAVYMAVHFDRITESGGAGDAQVGSAEKGDRMLSGCTSALADIVVRDTWAQ